MAGNRRWVTRDEIAEIYDTMAARKLKKINETLRITKGQSLIAQSDLDEAYALQDRAMSIRDTERLSKPLGERVA